MRDGETTSGVGHLERMKRDSGIKGWGDSMIDYKEMWFIVIWIDKVRGKDKTYTDERLKTKMRYLRVSHTQELEHLEIKMRLIDEKFASVMGEFVFVKL
jgi:hypothetical protein